MVCSISSDSNNFSTTLLQNALPLSEWILFGIPEVKVPYMVENHVDNDRYIPKHLPLYKVENVMEVIELSRDLQNVVFSDEELLKRCKNLRKIANTI